MKNQKKQIAIKNKTLGVKMLTRTKSEEVIFDIAKLNDSPFKDTIEYLISYYDSPTEYMVSSLLAVMSGAIGRNAELKVTDSITIFPNLNILLVGKQGIGRKTTTINIAKSFLNGLPDTFVNTYLEFPNEFDFEDLSNGKASLGETQINRLLEYLGNNLSKIDAFLYSILGDTSTNGGSALRYFGKLSHSDIVLMFEKLMNMRKIKMKISKKGTDLFNKYDIESYNKFLKNNDTKLHSQAIVNALKFSMLISLSKNSTKIKLSDIEDGIYLNSYFQKNYNKLLNVISR